MLFPTLAIPRLAFILVYLTLPSLSNQTIRFRIPGLGTIIGSTNISTWNKHTIYQFHGIPYGLPPSGPRRFKPPVKALPWNEELNATQFSRKCPQANTEKELNDLRHRIVAGEDVEDCLTLNVYTPFDPNLCPKIGLPVMFYIHGGSFRVGSAQSFRPNYLLDNRDVVLVVIQYRLGPLGFLTFLTDEVPGNMGLMDMVMALEWTQDYIRYFCGDPSQVTLFGQSSGAAAVSLMLASPLVTPNMFQRVIVQSGSSLCDWAVDREPIEHAKRIAALSNCTEETQEKLLECLNSRTAWDLLIAHSDFLTEVLMTEGQAVKGNNGGNHAVIQTQGGATVFLNEDPLVLFKKGHFRKIPMMAGVTKHEGSFFLGNIYDFILQKNNMTNETEYLSNEFIKATLQFSGIIDTTNAITDIFQEKFFTPEEIGNFTAMTPGLIDICGLTLLKSCTLQQIRLNQKYQTSYLYSFNFKGHLTKFGYGEEVNYPFEGGVAHSDDLVYLFPDSKGELYEEEAKVAKIVVKLWTNFAKNGKPSAGNNIVEWLPMENQYGPYLRIDKESTMEKNYFNEYNITITEGLTGERLNKNVAGQISMNYIFVIFLSAILNCNL